MQDSSTPNPWERQTTNGKAESPQACAAFCIYRDLGPKRSLAEVARALGGDNMVLKGCQKRPSGRIQYWSKNWNWVARANSWDDEVDRQRREAQAEEIIRMSKRNATQAESAAAALMVSTRELLRRLQSDPDALSKIDMADLLMIAANTAKHIPAIHKAERMARLGGDGLLPSRYWHDGAVRQLRCGMGKQIAWDRPYSPEPLGLFL